jgi:tripartite-type tricarboxylate transporter receptor subunit TctC
MARMIQPRLSTLLGQSVIVENRVGAGGYIGNEYVANSPPDGHTIALQAFGGMHAYLFTKGLRDMARELTPVAMMVETPNLALISATLPQKTLKEFIDYARANKGKLNAAFVSNTAISLDGLVFLRAIDVDMLQVPFNGSVPVYASLARGETQFFMATVGGSRPNIDAGQVRPLAVTSSRRAPQLPDVPTARELGYNIEATQIWALFVPVKTPPAVIRILNEKLAAAINEPDTRQRLEKLGYTVDPGQPEALAARLAAESQTLERAARDAGIVPQ